MGIANLHKLFQKKKKKEKEQRIEEQDLLTNLRNKKIKPRYCRNTFFQAHLLLARLRQLLTPINDSASSIWNGHKVVFFFQLSQISASNTRLAGAFSSIRTTRPYQRNRWILIRCTMFMSSRSSNSSLLNGEWGNHCQPTQHRRSYVWLFSRILLRLLH